MQLQAGGTHVKAPCGSKSLISQLTRSVTSLGHRRRLSNRNAAADSICALYPPKINKGMNPTALCVQGIDGAVSGCEWRAGMLVTLCSWFRSRRMQVAWVEDVSDGDKSEERSDREQTVDPGTVGEFLREAVLARLGELMILRTHNIFYLTWTQACYYRDHCLCSIWPNNNSKLLLH